MPNNESKPWDNFTPPGGQMRIEGTDEVPLVTDQPVEVIARTKKRTADQTEQLFQTVDKQPSSDSKKDSRRVTAARPYRGRYTDTTDRSLRALRSGLEGDPPDTTNPDADIDEVFGADSARRIVK